MIEQLAELPHVIGIKQSGGNIHLLADILVRLKDKLTILAAIDDLHFPSFVMGVHGTLAAIPTVTPHLTVKLWRATQAGDYDLARQIHETILPIWRAVEGPSMPAKIKEALRLQGRPAGKARHPIQAVNAKEQKQIANALKQADLLAVEYQQG